MKIVQTIIISIAFLSLVSCNNSSDYPSVLLSADSIADIDGKEALEFLDNLKNSTIEYDERDKHFYNLLRIKAADKAYITHTSDSAIIPILKYFESGDPQLRALAYYYGGRVYRDLGDTPQALDYFQKALDNSHNYIRKDILRQIYSQLGSIYASQQAYDLALNTHKKMWDFCASLQDSIGIVHAITDCGNIYKRIENFDSAIICFDIALKIAKQYNKDKRLVPMLYSQKGAVYLRINDLPNAKHCLDMCIDNHDKLEDDVVDNLASLYYYKSRQTDSMLIYTNKMLQKNDIYGNTVAHARLAYTALRNKKPQKALEHIENYLACRDSVEKLTDTENIRRMDALYNYSIRERENTQLKIENEKTQRNIIYIIIGIFVFLLLLGAYLFFAYLKRKAQRAALIHQKTLARERLCQSQQIINESTEKIADLQQQLHDVTLLNQELQADIASHNMETKMRKDKLATTPIVRKIRQIVTTDKSTNLSNDDWKELEREINIVFTTFTDTIDSFIYRLKEHERHICLLLKSGISISEIANITNRSKEAISSTRRRLYYKVFGITGSSEMWDAFIDSIE